MPAATSDGQRDPLEQDKRRKRRVGRCGRSRTDWLPCGPGNRASAGQARHAAGVRWARRCRRRRPHVCHAACVVVRHRFRRGRIRPRCGRTSMRRAGSDQGAVSGEPWGGEVARGMLQRLARQELVAGPRAVTMTRPPTLTSAWRSRRRGHHRRVPTRRRCLRPVQTVGPPRRRRRRSGTLARAWHRSPVRSR